LNERRTRDRVTFAAVCLGVAVPFIYYGIQLAGAASYSGYSFIRHPASELGSSRAPHAAIFNVGIMTQGVVTLVVAAGFQAAMRRLRVRPVPATLVALALAVNGVQTLWAGYFPMPHPRHGGHPAFIAAMILLPVFLTAALWRGGGAALRAYFLATLLLLLVMVPLMSGLVAIDRSKYDGLLQRVYTLTVFPPIAVAACALARRLADARTAGQRLETR
jgi:hypothetical membrane protein